MVPEFNRSRQVRHYSTNQIEVIYDTSHWELLHHLRGEAIRIMEALANRILHSAVHGSVGRGDVNINSDVDVFIPRIVSSHAVELALTLYGFEIYSRKIAQATPNHAPKAHIYLDADEKRSVTFPLVPFRQLELDFYKFGGTLELEDLREDMRVCGCDKKLRLITPTSRGHFQSPIQGHEAEVAKILGLGEDIVIERVRVLTRRDQIGRTGIVLSVSLLENEVFEEVLKRLIDSNPIVRRRCVVK